MFPYRRQGPKKRNRQGGGGTPPRRNRGPQKGLPNSARDLLPMMQPATKALAQMLAGHVPVSGQFGHAQALAAQAERLIAERAHNRLNPSEREEFFEQVARLKLTIADAEAEAEAQSRDEPAPAPPPAAAVGRDRLREMARAFAGGPHQRSRTPNGASTADLADAKGTRGGEREPAAPSPSTAGRTERAGDETGRPRPDEPEGGAETSARDETPAERSETARPGRLQLSGSAAQEAADAVRSNEHAPRSGRAAPTRRRKPETEAAAPAPATPAPVSENGAGEEPPGEAAENGDDQRTEHAAPQEAGQRRVARRSRASKSKGVPEGWVIDDEGYVVPGPS